MGQMEVSDAVLVSRLGTLEDRLTEVEKRLNISLTPLFSPFLS
jgi:hypothetical protein